MKLHQDRMRETIGRICCAQCTKELNSHMPNENKQKRHHKSLTNLSASPIETWTCCTPEIKHKIRMAERFALAHPVVLIQKCRSQAILAMNESGLHRRRPRSPYSFPRRERKRRRERRVQ